MSRLNSSQSNAVGQHHHLSNQIFNADTGDPFTGGFTPVSALLGTDNGFDLSSSTPLLWDVLYDNSFNWTALLTIPVGLGLSFVFNASAATITATEAGIWAFTLNLQAPADATAEVITTLVPTIAGDYRKAPAVGGSLVQTVAAVVPMGIGDAIAPAVVGVTIPTASPYIAFAYLQIVRLA